LGGRWVRSRVESCRTTGQAASRGLASQPPPCIQPDTHLSGRRLSICGSECSGVCSLERLKAEAFSRAPTSRACLTGLLQQAQQEAQAGRQAGSAKQAFSKDRCNDPLAVDAGKVTLAITLRLWLPDCGGQGLQVEGQVVPPPQHHQRLPAPASPHGCSSKSRDWSTPVSML
jgi:hypothetical protein